jgi:hypothetical protein
MSRLSSRRLIVWSFVTLLASLLVLGTVAPAAGGLRMRGAITKTKDIPVASSQTGGGKLRCPRGDRVVAGGVFWYEQGQPITPGTAENRTVAASLPIGNGIGWFASGRNGAASAAILQIVIHCLPAERVGPYASRTIWLDGSPASGSLSCGAGKRAVTGGAAWQVEGEPLDASTAADSHLSGSTATRDARGWFANGQGGVGDASLRLVVLCRPKDSVGAYSTVVKEMPMVPGDPTGDYLACPDRRRVVTGGAFWKDASGQPTIWLLASSTPTTDKRGWYAAGQSFFPGDELVVIAHCRPR